MLGITLLYNPVPHVLFTYYSNHNKWVITTNPEPNLNTCSYLYSPVLSCSSLQVGYTYCKIKCNRMLLKRSGLLTAEDKNRNVGLGPVIMGAFKKYQQLIIVNIIKILCRSLQCSAASPLFRFSMYRVRCAIKSDLQPSITWPLWL